MILFCCDGSDGARTAIERAGELLHGKQPARVLTVWDWGSGRPGEESAESRAEQGAEHARAAGFDARAHVRASNTTTAETILAEAADVHARLIVLGTRGLSGAKSLLMGSVSHEVAQRADRPVLVVPSAEVAARRAARRS